MEKNAVGNRIIELCEEKGITVNALAVKSKVPPSTLKNIVYGQVKNTGVKTIEQICQGLNISIRDFFDGNDFE